MAKHERNDGFDAAFEEAVRSGFHVDIPEPDLTWNKMAALITRQARKRKMKKRLQLAGMTAAALLLGAVLFGRPQETEAFLPVAQFVSGVRDDVVTLFQGNKKKLERDKLPEGVMLTSPPPEGVGPVMGKDRAYLSIAKQVQVNSYEEAEAYTHTEIPEPLFIPEGFKLERLVLGLTESKETVQIISQYKEKSTTGYITLTRFLNNADLLESATQLDKEAEKAESVTINGTSGAYVHSDGKKNMILWGDGHYKFVLTSTLTKEDMLKIAESVK